MGISEKYCKIPLPLIESEYTFQTKPSKMYFFIHQIIFYCYFKWHFEESDLPLPAVFID